MDSNKHTAPITTTTTTTISQMNSMNSSEKLLSQNIQNSSQIQSSNASTTIVTSYNSDGTTSGDNRHTTTTISNITLTLSPNQSISSAMNAATMQSSGSSGGGSGNSGNSNGNATKNMGASVNACQPRLHPKKRKFNIAELEEMDPPIHANSHSHNSNNNNNANDNNNTINTNNKNNGNQNGTDSNFADASVSIMNSAPIHKDITDKSVNWTISNDNGLRASNAIIVTHVGSTAHMPPVRSIANEHTLVVSANSHLNPNVPTANAHDGKRSHSQFSQNNRKTDNGSTKTDNGSLMIIRNEYPVIASSQHELTTPMNVISSAPNVSHRSPRSTESLKYGVQSSSIIRIAGPATAAAAVTTAASASANEQSLDLSEWCNHRVLARQEDIYVAGIIRSVDASNTILVEFDYPEGTQQSYTDVLGIGRFDIISDASPSVGDITIGTRVVCSSQTNRQGHASFIEGEIMQILNDTKQFVVRTIASDEVKTVKRAQIRLLQPPWWDELNDTNAMGDGAHTARVITGQIKQLGMDTNMYSNTMAGAVAAAAGGNTLNSSGASNATNNRNVKYMSTPLQVHHLLPTVQVKRVC